MASTDTSTSSQVPASNTEEHKRMVDDAFLNKLKGLVERLRLENATLKKSLYSERSEVRALKGRHESALRNLKTESKKREDLLEKQLRTLTKYDKTDDIPDNNKLIELKRLTTEIQSLKAANKGLQEKLKVAQTAECARAAELRAQMAKHAALEEAARRDTRAQCHKLLEEIKSKERVIIQLRRDGARLTNDQFDECRHTMKRRVTVHNKRKICFDCRIGRDYRTYNHNCFRQVVYQIPRLLCELRYSSVDMITNLPAKCGDYGESPLVETV